ncbi:MAG: hypothetical protein DLM53_00320 [Candidatus Eremiobacter antarcticus]|nr:MAG: hypothetical protein DLM53_00320 [Candidatus Eremiobacter sp. RRmetagenome_bin22]
MRQKPNLKPLARAIILAGLSLIVSVSVRQPTSRIDATDVRSFFYKDSRADLAQAKANGVQDVSLVFAAKRGMNGVLALAIEASGGTLRVRDDAINYIRARVPLNQIDVIIQSGAVESAAFNVGSQKSAARPFARTHLRPTDSEFERQWPPRQSDFPLTHPFSPLHDMDADEFQRAHPTFDGRGVVVAVLDGNFDFLLPELQSAMTADGAAVPKLADFRISTDPTENRSPQWVNMSAQVTSADGKATFKGKHFVLPHPGTYRIGFFSERGWGEDDAAYIHKDIDRDGNPPGDDGLFGVLWDESHNLVYVDTDRSGDFSKKNAMRDYRAAHQTGVFGHIRPSRAVRDSIGFAVQTDPKDKYVAIVVGIYQHATSIVGALAANPRPHGRFRGIAPNVQLASISYGVGPLGAMIDALRMSFEDPKIDAVLFEWDYELFGRYLLRDGHNVASIIIDRLAQRYQKPIFIPGDNSPGLALAAELGMHTHAIIVGGYESRDAYRRNLGLFTKYQDNLHWGGLSHGPGANGALKPDVLAPSGSLGLDPGYRDTDTIGGELKGLFHLPPGYGISGGTSQATPLATSAAVLLISAAKQTHTPYNADRLYYALRNGARFIAHHQAYEQGNGLVDVAQAWSILHQLRDNSPLTFVSAAPVQTVNSNLFQTPNIGPGLYEREGWNAGMQAARAIVVTRTSGPVHRMRFQVGWIGNDGTFSGPPSVWLPLNAPTAIPIRIHVRKRGPHSALLTLNNDQMHGAQYRVMTTIVAANEFDEARGFVVKDSIDVARPGDGGFFLNVPSRVNVLKATISVEKANVLAYWISPDGNEAAGEWSRGSDEGGERTLVMPRPMAGVWELVLDNSFADEMSYDPDRPRPLLDTHVSLEARVYRAEIDSTPGTKQQPLTFVATNTLAAAPARLVGNSLASVFQAAPTIAQDDLQEYAIDVQPGSDSVGAAVSSAPTTDLDLYLFNCTKSKCSLVAQGSSRGGNELVVANHPSAGRCLR